jgi:hypothetical protein
MPPKAAHCRQMMARIAQDHRQQHHHPQGIGKPVHDHRRDADHLDRIGIGHGIAGDHAAGCRSPANAGQPGGAAEGIKPALCGDQQNADNHQRQTTKAGAAGRLVQNYKGADGREHRPGAAGHRIDDR